MQKRTCNSCAYDLKGASPCINCFHYSHWVSIDVFKNETPLTKQEGGQHYKDKAIQPIVYIHANNLGFCAGNVVKYITRYKEKNGAEDVRKAIHYCQLLLELEYGEKD